MDNLLFYTLLIALAYYFMVYAKPTSTRPDPLTHSKSTQTDSISTERTEYEPGPIQFPSNQTIPDPEEMKNLQAQITTLTQDQAQKERTITGLNQSYERLETKKDEQISTLNQQITTLKSQLTSLQQTQTSDQKELEKTLDNLLKGMADLSQDLDKN